MKIIILQHIDSETPGYIKDLMLGDGFDLTTVELDIGEKIPADISDQILTKAINNAKKIAENFSYVGVLTIEYFVTENDELLLNELAPRFHNSGHLTIEAFNISQFENHVRAVCNLKSKPIEKISNAEMYNVLGFEIQNYKKKSFKKNEFFYDYLKKEPRKGRKMGHLTILKD